MPEEIISHRLLLKRTLDEHYQQPDGEFTTLPPEISKLIDPEILLSLKICVTRYSTNYVNGPHATLPVDLGVLSQRRSKVPCILIYRYADGQFMVAIETCRNCVIFNTVDDKIWTNGKSLDYLLFDVPLSPYYTSIHAVARAVGYLYDTAPYDTKSSV